MKKAATLVVDQEFVGYEILPSYIGNYFISHEIRIPSLNNQDDSWKVGGALFSWLNYI